MSKLSFKDKTNIYSGGKMKSQYQHHHINKDLKILELFKICLKNSMYNGLMKIFFRILKNKIFYDQEDKYR